MAKSEIKNLLDKTEWLLAEADRAAVRAGDQLKLLKERVRLNRPIMERAERQFGRRPMLWEALKP